VSGEAPFYCLGLTGYPLTHSLSPRLHAAALRAMGLAGEYDLYPVSPDADLASGQAAGLQSLCSRLRRGELHGLNVTVPHKSAVLPFLDELTPAAQAIGAANTLYARDGRLIGDNTDAPGLLADLRRVFPDLFPDGPPSGELAGRRKALVLGAGGAARAVTYALASIGWWVVVAARDIEQARKMVFSLPYRHRLLPVRLTFEDLYDCLKLPLLVVNATSAGMLPDADATPWPAGLRLPKQAALYDLVYAPPETRLMRLARAAGMQASNGLGMLVEQAALALELWTGRPVPRAAMWAEILP
jgi:shikimate dehydrogenase